MQSAQTELHIHLLPEMTYESAKWNSLHTCKMGSSQCISHRRC